MRAETRYISDDGSKFDTEAECLEYEKSDLFEIRKIYDELQHKSNFLGGKSYEYVTYNLFTKRIGFVQKHYFAGMIGSAMYVGLVNNKACCFETRYYSGFGEIVNINSFTFIK
jgi:hypothetical protein